MPPNNGCYKYLIVVPSEASFGPQPQNCSLTRVEALNDSREGRDGAEGAALLNS